MDTMADLTTDLARQDQVFLARLIERLPLGTIPKEVKQLFIDDPKAVNWLAERMQYYRNISIQSPHEEMKPSSKVVPVSARNIVLASFFQPRKGLRCHNYNIFMEKVLATARDDDLADISECHFTDLSRSMHEREIIVEYTGGSELEAKKKASTLNQLKTYLTHQANGEDGPLLVNGCANIFYVVGKNGILFVVDVMWRGGQWDVFVWGLGEYGYWDSGSRLFFSKPRVLNSSTI